MKDLVTNSTVLCVFGARNILVKETFIPALLDLVS